MNEKTVNLFESIKQKRRDVIFTILMVSLYFLFYIIVKQIFYSVVRVGDYIYIKEKYFFTFYSISTLPIFFFLFFKFNICVKFWDNTDKPHLIDYLFFGVICLFLFFSFNQTDLNHTAVQGNALLDMVLRGINVLEFYDYTQGWASYLLPQYILFAIWSIPVKIAYMIIGLQPIGINEAVRINGITLWWYKLLPTLFYVGSAFIIYKICIQLNFDRNKAKWISFIFFIFPMATFSQFIFGQYDSMGLFFELIMIYYFLKNKLLIATLFCMIAITFKTFPIFIYIPILLLFEKKIWKIISYIVIAFSGYLFFNLLFLGSRAFNSSEFNTGMFYRLLTVGINTSFGVVSYFLLFLISACVFAYFVKIQDKDKLTINKYIMYIPLFVYSSFFSFVLTHPMWVLILVPYLVINAFLSRNAKYMMFILIGASIGFLFTVVTVPNFFQNVDACMINLGIFPKIYGFYNGVDANFVGSANSVAIYGFNGNGEGFKSLNRIVSLNGLIYYGIYFTLFVSMLFVNLILSFPNEKNILRNKNTLQQQFKTGRDVIWISGLIVLLFTIPSLLLFYSQSPK
jgi:hypothetical protein